MGSLKETKYDEKGGLREMLLQRNLNAIQKVKKLRQEFAKQQVAGNALAEEKAKADLNRKIEEIRGEKGVPNVIIKGTDEGTYTNLIDCLDEMQICDIGKYVIVPIDDFDKEMIEYYKKNGSKSSDSAQ